MIMCVTFVHALSGGVGALQISIIIIWAWSAIWTVLTILYGFTRVAVVGIEWCVSMSGWW